MVDSPGGEVPVPKAVIGGLGGQGVTLFALTYGRRHFFLPLVGNGELFASLAERAQQFSLVQGFTEQRRPGKVRLLLQARHERLGDGQETPIRFRALQREQVNNVPFLSPANSSSGGRTPRPCCNG